MKRFLILGTALAALTLAPAPARAQFEHPDLKGGKKSVRSVLILPAMVSVTKAGVKSSEPMIEESRAVEEALPHILAQVLGEFGCQVADNPFTPAALEANEELRYALGDIQNKFDAVHEQLARKPKDVRTGRFTLGDDVSKVNTTGSDALIFIRGSGYLSTGGKKTFALLVGGPGLIEGIYVEVTLVDGQTGNILYFGRSMTTGNFVKNTSSMTKPIKGSFKNYGKAVGKKKA